MVELCTHLAIERARLVNSHLKLARPISIPTRSLISKTVSIGDTAPTSTNSVTLGYSSSGGGGIARAAVSASSSGNSSIASSGQ